MKVFTGVDGCPQGWVSVTIDARGFVSAGRFDSFATLIAAHEKVASIGSEVTADVYDLLTIASGIEDHRGNTTRFLVIGRAQRVRNPESFDAAEDDDVAGRCLVHLVALQTMKSV